MSFVPHETVWVTDEETEESSQKSDDRTKDEQSAEQRRTAWQERLRRGVRYLTHMDPRGNRMPEVGTRCLVVVGNAQQDLGQMAQVTQQKTRMVEIQFRGVKNRRLEHKTKQPSSLIMLEEGLTLKQDAHGTVWVCRETS
jgi:hypothetical protein